MCDSRWGNLHLGTSSNTICAAGCAMSSVAMTLATFHENVNGQTTDPKTLNSWLINHGGYVSGDLLVWNSIAPLGKLHMLEYVSSISRTQLQQYIRSCYPVIANVRNGGHWVLITGYESSNSDLYYVNDPGFNTDSYTYQGMSHFVVYTNKTMDI